MRYCAPSPWPFSITRFFWTCYTCMFVSTDLHLVWFSSAFGSGKLSAPSIFWLLVPGMLLLAPVALALWLQVADVLVLYSFITLFELSFSRLLEWLPFWPYVKLIATCWLVLPVFNGAAYVHENFVRQMLLNPNARFSPGQRIMNAMSPSTKNSVERFVHQYGPDALDRAMKRAEKEAKINRNGGYDDDEY